MVAAVVAGWYCGGMRQISNWSSRLDRLSPNEYAMLVFATVAWSFLTVFLAVSVWRIVEVSG